MSGVKLVEVQPDDDGIRLDKWFKLHYPNLSFGALQKLLRSGQVRVDSGRVKTGHRVSAGQTVRVPPISQESGAPPKKRPHVDPTMAEKLLDMVIHMDGSVIVLNKPCGLAVQGGTKTDHHIDGMLDALKFKMPEAPRLVHRLDRDTSGVLVLARTRKAAQELGNAFKSRDALKIYWALVHGVPRPDRGTIEAPLLKTGAAGEQRMTIVPAGTEGAQQAVTDYIIIDHAGREYSWLALALRTGRTHQLRVHCAAIECPIYADAKYGTREDLEMEGFDQKMHLHARSVDIPHPDGGRLSVEAELPIHMMQSWTFLEFDMSDLAAREPFADEIGNG